MLRKNTDPVPFWRKALTRALNVFKKNLLTGFEKYMKISFINYFLFIVNISLLVHYVIVAVIAIFPTYMTSGNIKVQYHFIMSTSTKP